MNPPFFAVTLFVVALIGSQPEVQLKSGQKWRGANLLEYDGGVALKLSGQVENVVIGPARIKGAYQAIYTANDKAVVRNVTMQGLTLTELGREGIRIRGDTDGVTIRDFTIRMAATPQSGDQLPTGIAAYKGRNIVVENGNISGFKMVKVKGKFTNGDGFAAEGGVDGLTVRNVRADGNSDAGFDLKSKNTYLDRVSASGNGRNYRFWRPIRAGSLTVGEIQDAGIWVKGAPEPTLITIDRLIVRSGAPGRAIIRIEGGRADIRIKSCDIKIPAGAVMVKDESGGSKLLLGPGCKT